MEDERRIRSRRSRHSENAQSGGKIKKFLIIAIILVVVVVIFSVVWYNISLTGTGTAEEKVSVEIPIGSGSSKIAKILKENDVIRSESAFKMYVKLNHVTDFQAGSYDLTKNMSVSEITEALKTGKVLKESEVKITFVEGTTFTSFAKLIAENTNNTEEDVYNLVKDEEYLDSLINEYWFITDEIKNENIYYALEGYLAPNTYEFETKDVTVKEIFKTLLDQMENVLEPYKDAIQNSEYSAHEILTIASIVETEAIFDKDRKNIASVVYNRLEQNMSLGCDGTTYYAFKIELGSRELYKSEINTYNPYNTRGPNMEGKLPVGPVASLSEESIEAAVYPNETDYLYFVADSSGNTYFTKTSTEHQNMIDSIKSSGNWTTFD